MAFSLEDNHIAVNYHYIEDPRPDATGIFPCSVKDFERQIAFLGKHFAFASIPEIFEAAQRNAKEKLCAITFDDGLRDQFENAVPILKKYHASATFFVITGTLKGMLPLAYKIHILTSHAPMNEVAIMFNAFLSDSFPQTADLYHMQGDRRITNRRLHEDVLSANVKETLMEIPANMRNAFFDIALTGNLKINETELCKNFFMDKKEIATLERDGFTVGSHTHQHESLEHKDKTYMQRDAIASADLFSQFLEKQPTIISYPHGRSNQAIGSALQENGFTHGVTIERRAVLRGDDPLRIPRFDMGDIKDFLTAYE